MKKLIIIFLVLLLAVLLGIFAHRTPSNLFITFGSMHIQTTLWFAIAVAIVGGFLIYQLWRLLRGIYHLPSHLHHFSVERRDARNQKLTHRALCALFEGYWQKSEKYLVKSVSNDGYAFFHYLGAAQVAFLQKNYLDGDVYMKKAQQVAQPSETLALEITRGRWQLAIAEYQQALKTFLLLQKISPNHVAVLNGLKESYLALENWQALHDLLPKLRRHAHLSAAICDALEQRTYIALLKQAGKLPSLTELEETWHKVPGKWRQTPAILAVYTHYLIQQQQHKKAEDLLKMVLKKHLDPVLLAQYASLTSADVAKQLSRAESWLKHNEQNADLLFCLGKLCFRLRLWGKAKTYLEASLKNRPQAEVYSLLGQVLEQLGERAAALDCYKEGLKFVIVD